MNAGSLLLLCALSLFLLFGCIGTVPQKDYDALKASCAQEKQDLQSQLSAENAKGSDAANRLSDCLSSSGALAAKIAAKDAEIYRLRGEELVLNQARGKAALYSGYGIALQYYNETYGPGSIPNTYRLNRLDAQVRSLSDPNLLLLWQRLRNCETITTCADAKAAFISGISDGQAALALQVVGIVKEQNGTG